MKHTAIASLVVLQVLAACASPRAPLPAAHAPAQAEPISPSV